MASEMKMKIDLSGLKHIVAEKARLAVLQAEAQQFNRRRDMIRINENMEKNEYNMKVANLLAGTNMKPSIVGQINSPNQKLCYDFVDFGKIEKKAPIEYLNPDKLDYLVPNPDKQNNKLKEDMPLSFLEIKEGEVNKGKEWYMKRDPKLPDGIAELMARYNWGDIKNMPNKKQYKNAQKKAKGKGKDILDGLEIKKGDFCVKFD
jgi:succinate dehydrogenase/fumarate reductase flavoprotein subunit